MAASTTVERIAFFTTPAVWMLTNFLRDAQCAHLINLAQEQLRPSTVLDHDTAGDRVIAERNSWQTSLTVGQDPMVAEIEQRLAQHLGMPVENGEGLQIVRYEIGQEFQAHHDYFDPAFPGCVEVLKHGGQRWFTVLMYLAEPEAGGETLFPNIRLKVKPTKGHALCFSNLRADGSLDVDSLHGSLPVQAGEKWIATKWVRVGRVSS